VVVAAFGIAVGVVVIDIWILLGRLNYLMVVVALDFLVFLSQILRRDKRQSHMGRSHGHSFLPFFLFSLLSANLKFEISLLQEALFGGE
jgi:hypothetical protein